MNTLSIQTGLATNYRLEWEIQLKVSKHDFFFGKCVTTLSRQILRGNGFAVHYIYRIHYHYGLTKILLLKFYFILMYIHYGRFGGVVVSG
jgi:hypothetical protein